MFLFEFTETLIESAHDILFHVTNVNAAASILTNQEFELGFSLAKDSAENFRPKGSSKYFYLSTARSPASGFIATRRSSGHVQVLFELNGNWFNKHGYVTKPVDYFNGAPGSSDEMEDRVFSKEPTIKFPNDAHSLINALHVYLPQSMASGVAQSLLPLVVQAKKQNIPLYVYINPNSWLTRRKDKAFPYDKFIQAMKIELQADKRGFSAKSPSVFSSKFNSTGMTHLRAIDAKRDYKALLNLIQARSPEQIKEDTFYVIDELARVIDADAAIKRLFIRVKFNLGSKASGQLVAAIKKSGTSPDNVWDTLGRKWIGLSYGLDKQFKTPPKDPKYDPGTKDWDFV
jgi:hypothetical protein